MQRFHEGGAKARRNIVIARSGVTKQSPDAATQIAASAANSDGFLVMTNFKPSPPPIVIARRPRSFTSGKGEKERDEAIQCFAPEILGCRVTFGRSQ